ncbi:MAG: hypothetical protein ABIP45_01275 [Knoellia sp.]
MTMTPTILYVDFTCPWSYLAHRRLALLSADGMDVEVRAVEHEPKRSHLGLVDKDEFPRLREEVSRVEHALLPGESLPIELRGFVPNTRAAISAYAESSCAGVAPIAAPILFEAHWRDGLDLGNPSVVRVLLADAVMSGTSPSDPQRRWGHCVDVTGGPMTSMAWQLVRAWRHQWTDLEKEVVPVLLPETGNIRYGVDAVDHLGQLLMERGIDPSTEPVWPQPGPRPPLDGHGRTQILYGPLGVA